MPTPFAMVMLGLLVLAAVAGVVVWARQYIGRRHDRVGPPASSDTPYSAETAAAQHTRMTDRGGWV
ncbi:hypothetical protein [Phycicoccus duodecadis]|uniref:Uncharacterized protein n=1 Tax=Phycicoccus duodecadis TaxID=173053 RepID=A0A2N3YJ59_9MICO|nr:hypothetical protein [Phycicoccus duodecadis]PKW26873.1 hypothetical protein ATL31_1700 [Phycicoccus duodecadis]